MKMFRRVPGRNMGQPLRFLHFFTTFGCGGLELRVARILNALGPDIRHTIVAIKGNTEAVSRLDAALNVDVVRAPPESGLLYPLALRRVLASVRPDLALTYNWGAIKAVIGAAPLPLCPVIHHEGGLGIQEAERRKFHRCLLRRIFLNRVYSTVVVSTTLERMALDEFKLRRDRVRLIRSGVDAERFHPGRNLELRRRLGAGERTLVFGYVGLLRPEKNLGLLIRAFEDARLEDARLILVGGGECRNELADLARSPNVIFVGNVSDPAPYYGAFDVFAMSSATEQTPNALLEAMASGLPAVVTDAGDCAELLGPLAQPLVVRRGDAAAYEMAMRCAANDADLRARLGEENRRRVVARYSADRMIGEYSELYKAAIRDFRTRLRT